MNKTITSVLAAIGFAASAPASAIIVGGIDFGVLGADPIHTHLETATLAQTLVNGDGQTATVYGFVTTVNGDTTYCADGSANCGLFYTATFGGSDFTAGATPADDSRVEFTSATISVYYSDTAPINLLNQSSPTNLLTIQALTPWVTLTGHGNLGGESDPSAVANGIGKFTGASLTGEGSGLFDVTGGIASVVSFLDANGVLDAAGGTTDIILASSFNNRVLNPFDVLGGFATGCQDGTAAPGAWCFQGTASLRGDTQIPEPGILGLVGIGLLGLGAAARRRKA